MKIDFISDLHVNHYLNSKSKNKQKLKIHEFVSDIEGIGTSDILLLGGDYSESNGTTIEMLKCFATYYDQVYFIVGNHDYYLTSIHHCIKYDYNSLNRVEDLYTRAKELGNVTPLDHEVIEIEDKNIAAGLLWYYPQNEKDMLFYKYFMPDSSHIRIPGEIDHLNTLHEHSMNWYNSLQGQNIDLMLTHTGPVIPPSYMNPHKPNSLFDVTVPFFASKKWIFGHSHLLGDFEQDGTHFYTNCGGYPRELKEKRIRTIEI